MKREKLTKEAKNAKLEKDKTKISQYHEVKSKVFTARSNKEYTIGMLNNVTDLLMINPEFYTVWNIRRETLVALFDSSQLDKYKALNDDLKMVMLLLKRFPKCYWIYNHRLWCLKVLGEKADWIVELGIVSKLLSLDPRNFHGWQLRRIVVQSMESQDKSKVDQLKINIQEFEFTTSKVNNNISNFSAWHNRSKLIPKIHQLYNETEIDLDANLIKYRDLFDDPLLLLKHEIKLINTGMYVDVDDSSVWLYLYWLLSDDFFVKRLNETFYKGILKEQLMVISELNDLEKEDNGKDNHWCLKAIILIKCLLMKLEGESEFLTEEIKSLLNILAEIDPLRKGRYLDQVNGKASLLY